MRAREWTIAGCYRDPEDYGVPTLPHLEVRRLDCGGIAFADGDGEAFIAAENPMKARR
ncbi:hypothetical protein HWV23_03900 [Natronomonas halophila]|jgi:hypothetical protein|uniref:hypothetical protein n=1 Tax=Natronomonas halophila TaxID=2747817 RepID=UPI0015B54DA4|nr:hypothetical protein [Natronomonas halophila]QLD84895.1 hypothetical protein HWV23_03900 [Natronomonas halophila]